jgi:hypothetical protein
VQARADLLATPPVTLADARAALECIDKIDWQGADLSAFVATLLKSALLGCSARFRPGQQDGPPRTNRRAVFLE